MIQPKIPLEPQERVSKWENYPPQQDHPTLQDDSADGEEGEVDYKSLDAEGRALVIDFGLFVLINTYCPNDSSTPATPVTPSPTLSRDKYKKQYHQLLSSRVESLIKNEKRQVVVLGDINACAAVIDHCEGDIMVSRARKANNLEKGDESGFWDREGTGEGRKWLRDWLCNQDGTGGPMVDIVRRFWPERQGMYTCKFVVPRLPSTGIKICFSLVRLEHQAIRSRNELRNSDRLYPHYSRFNSLDQSSQYPTRNQR